MGKIGPHRFLFGKETTRSCEWRGIRYWSTASKFETMIVNS